MAASRVLAMVETKKTLTSLGVPLTDATDTELGRAYQHLHADACFVSARCFDLWGDCKNITKHLVDITTHLVDERHEFGTLDKPNIDALTAASRQSQFGRGGETVTDTAVRDSVEVPVTDDMHLNKSLLQTAQRVAEDLFGSNNIKKIVPDKIVVYSEGGHFDRHRDTVYATDHVGTVVAMLGTQGSFEGGELSFPTVSDCAYYQPGCAVAFYTDLPHQVEPVTKGDRVVVTFRVFVNTPSRLSILQVEESENGDDNCLCDVLETVDEPADEPEDGGACAKKVPQGTAEYAVAVFGHNRLNVPEFVKSEFVTQLQAATTPVVLGCMHLIPAASYEQGVGGLRGMDAWIAQRLTTCGFAVRPVLVLVDYDGSYDNDYSEATRTVRAMSDDPDVQKTLETAVFARAGSGSIASLEHSPYIEHTGNESAPLHMRYVCTGMLVTLRVE
jgi:predicted 2-oxoglutarate/Fe(II)-dependent dioxygenase YbiX